MCQALEDCMRQLSYINVSFYIGNNLLNADESLTMVTIQCLTSLRRTNNHPLINSVITGYVV